MMFEKEPGSSDLRLLWADLCFLVVFVGHIFGFLHTPWMLVFPIVWYVLSVLEYFGIWAHIWKSVIKRVRG
jgi:hypothetical protein